MPVLRLRLLITPALLAAVGLASWGAVRSTEAAPRAQSTGSGPPIPTRTATPARVDPTATPTRPRLTPTSRPTATPTRPSSTPTSSPTPTLRATPTATPTAVVPWPTLPGFSLLTPTPLVDVFDFPPGDLTGPIPTPTLGQVAAPLPVPDLIAFDIEVTQGMQSLNNDMPLVADRLTFVRIYVRTDGADYLDVKGLLQGTRDGQVLGVIPADNQPMVAHGNGGDRLDVDDSLYFGLPWNWFEEGTLHLSAFVYAGHPDGPFDHEPESFNNFIQTSVEFESGAGINLSFVPIHLHENYSAAQPEKLFTQQEPDFWPVVIGMLRYLPLPGFQLYAPPIDKVHCGMFGIGLPLGPEVFISQHGPCEFNLQEAGGAEAVNVMMSLMDALTDDPVEDLHYYGMVHPDFEPQMTFFNADGDSLSYTGLAWAGQAYGIMDGSPNGTVPWYSTGGHTMAHELGHRIGLDHVDCSGSEGDFGGIDEGFPWPAPDCSIANVDEEGFYGYDIWYQVLPGVNQPTVISNDPAESAPNQGFPLMGYMWPKYADAYGWCLVLATIGVECDAAVTPLLASVGSPHHARVRGESPQASAPQTQPESPYLLVSGVVQQNPLEASFALVLTLPKPPADHRQPPESSRVETGFELVLLDQQGQVLAAQPIDQTSINHQPHNTMPFLVGLPVAPGTARIEIRRAGRTMSERSFSPHPPAVRVLTPNGGEAFTSPFEIRWEASDPDGDTLNYTVQYSPDGGESWQVLAIGLAEPRLQVLSLYNLTGSDRASVRVLASDGANTGIDASDGVFSVPNSPPLPAIQSPGHRAVFPQGARVPIRGSATDREDGLLPAGRLTWESSLDGFLGVGDRLEPANLSPGNHVLTLTAEDSQGATAQAQVGLIVDPRLARDLPGEDEVALASRILAAGPDWQPAPARPPIPTLALVVILGAGAVLAILLMAPLLRSWLRR